jgi:hypothetical protein
MRSATFLVIGLLLASCGSPHAGFTELGDDVHVRLHVVGDGEATLTNTDSARLRIRIAPLGAEAGSLFSTERTYAGADLRKEGLLSVFDRLHVGDSMSVIMPARRVPWDAIGAAGIGALEDTAHVRMELMMLDLITPERMRAEAERLRLEDPAGYERRLIGAWVRQQGGAWMKWGTSDVYYRIEGTAVDTNTVRPGDQVHLSYTGFDLEAGREFDSTTRNGAAFNWTYGDPDQVMKGLEVAVHLMREGQRAEFIFPSLYAFGQRGIPGILGPNVPVRYQVKLDRVERAAVQ